MASRSLSPRPRVTDAAACAEQRACNGIAWRGRTIEARCLTSNELTDWYLPLRYDVLRRELDWTIGNVSGPAELRDAYDCDSIAFGILTANGQLIGAARLIMPALDTDVPSIRLLRSLGRQPHFPLPAAEISRVMVRMDCRKLGLFRILLLSGLLLAGSAGVRSLIISERDDVRSARVMANCGFIRFADGFAFVDELIAPDEPAATYVLDLCRSFGPETQRTIAAHRQTLMRAADGLFAADLLDRAGPA